MLCFAKSHFVILVRVFDEELLCASTKFLALPTGVHFNDEQATPMSTVRQENGATPSDDAEHTPSIHDTATGHRPVHERQLSRRARDLVESDLMITEDSPVTQHLQKRGNTQELDWRNFREVSSY